MFSRAGEIRRDEGCMDYAGQFLMTYPCHGMRGNQEWVYGPVSMAMIEYSAWPLRWRACMQKVSIQRKITLIYVNWN